MELDPIIDIFRQGLTLVAVLAFIIIIPGLAVGLCVAVFQAATQINEMSLSFIPKFLVTILCLVITGPWMVQSVTEFTRKIIMEIPGLIG